MADLPAMTSAELQTTKGFLGVSTGWLAQHLVLDERRIRRMERGDEEIPQVIVTFLDDLYEETKDNVEVLSARYRRRVKAADGDGVTLRTFRTDEDYHAAGGIYPAAWHRQLCARVAAAVPGLVLTH